MCPPVPPPAKKKLLWLITHPFSLRPQLRCGTCLARCYPAPATCHVERSETGGKAQSRHLLCGACRFNPVARPLDKLGVTKKTHRFKPIHSVSISLRLINWRASFTQNRIPRQSFIAKYIPTVGQKLTIE